MKLMPRVRDVRLARLEAERTRFDAAANLGQCMPMAWNTVRVLVRDGLVQAGIDPACAGALRSGASAGMTELDDIPELHRLGEQLAEGDDDGLAGRLEGKIGDIAQRFRDGHEPDFASASLAELLAWVLSRRGSCDG
jgi:hypothetical protein